MGEASHHRPLENVLPLRRASSTRPGEVVISDVDPTLGDSDDDVPFVGSPREALGVQGMPITVGGRFASLVEAGDEDVESGQLPLSTSSFATEAKNHRRRRRVRSEGSDLGCPGVVGAAIPLIDSSDDDAPFTVPAAAPARPSRRLVLVPESADATPQSIQDREWTAEHATGPDSVPETILDALEEDLERRTRRLSLVSGSQGQGATFETDFPQWESGAQFSMLSRLSEIQSEVVDMTDEEDSDVDEDIEVGPARSHGEDVESEATSGVGPMTDMSDTDSLADNAASEVSVDDIRVPSVEPDVEVRDPQVNSLENS